MIERIHKTSDKESKTLNIAGHEISAVLDTKEPYVIAREIFELLRTHCLQLLGLTPEHPILYKKYISTMNHYLRNSAPFIMHAGNFSSCSEAEIAEYKNNYTLFLSVISRISKLSQQQKNEFLIQMKHHHDDINELAGNHIQLMEQTLNSL